MVELAAKLACVMKLFVTRRMESKVAPRLSPAERLAVIEEDYQASELEFAFASRDLQAYATTHVDKRFTVIPGGWRTLDALSWPGWPTVAGLVLARVGHSSLCFSPFSAVLLR